MAEIFWPGSVLYFCSCKLASPFTSLYFCRYCIETRCQLCVYTETDSFFCPNCLENMPSAEAKLKKNRCANCFECPSCGNALSARASAVAIPSDNPEEKATARKVFYLNCGFCRWSTRDVAIPDRNNASSGWQEPNNPVSKRVNSLVDFYKKLATKEQQDREKLKLKKKSYIHITPSSSFAAKTGLIKKRSSLSLMRSLALNRGNGGIDEVITFSEPAEATEQPARQDLYTEVVRLEQSSSISQMLAQPDFQYSQTCDFHPRHKHLIAKRSQRCRQCEHNLVKPEFNPASTKYKIQFFAINYIPQIQIANVPEFFHQQKSRVTLSLKNPLDYPVSVKLKLGNKPDSNTTDDKKEVLSEAEEKAMLEEQGKDGIKKPLRRTDSLSEKGLAKTPKIPVDNSGDNRMLGETAEVELPSVSLLLAAKDDAAEFDENEISTTKYEDDPNIIACRQANKIWFYIDVIPLRTSGDIQFSMLLSYDYKTIPSSSSKVAAKDGQEEPKIETVNLEHQVHLKLGKISENPMTQV